MYIQNLNLEISRPGKTISPISSLIITLLGEWTAMERQAIIDRLNRGRVLYIKKEGELGQKAGS